MGGPAFHEGEQAAQARQAAAARMAEIGARVIRDFMPDQHRELFQRLPLLFVGSVDAAGQPFASVLAGPPGFVQTPDPRTLVISARPLPGDPLARHLRPGAPIGLLGIELETRRRNRANGEITALLDGGAGFAVRVRQSFGNCPKHITPRPSRLRASGDAAPSLSAVAPPGEGRRLSAEALALIARADTFFIASAAPPGAGRDCDGVDVSHRGGPPGFVAASGSEQTVLAVPDYGGNNFFNTVGNLLLSPRAGLLFIDFARGDVLSLTGAAEVVFEGPEVEATPGAERLLRFLPHEGTWLAAV